MKVLMISGDPNVAVIDSVAEKRMQEYRSVLGELDILFVPGNIAGFISGFVRGYKMMSNKYDVITAQDAERSLIAYFLSRLFKVPWQMQIHTDIFSPFFYAESSLNKLRVGIAKYLLPKADGIRVVSERIKKSLEVFGGPRLYDRVTVLPIFVDVEKIKNAPIGADLHLLRPGEFIILMASRITREKNIALAMNAVKGMNVVLIVVGDGPETENLKNMAIKNVFFEPFNNNLSSYYKTCDLFLLTSNYEGYAMTLIEAASAGAKIISSDAGIAPEILEPENIFKPGDLEGLKAKLEAAMTGGVAPARPVSGLTKEVYLELYKKSFEACLKK